MEKADILRHPVIEVAIGGNMVEQYPVLFALATQTAFRSVSSRLLYPANSGAGKAGDAITVSLTSDGVTDLYFTGTVYSANVHGQYRELLLTDSFKKLRDTGFTAAYRKEKAVTIIDDILAVSGVTEKAVTCPNVEMARFSTLTIPGERCLELLIDALKEHGEEGLVFFFDEKDVFHFGTAENTGKNEGAAEAFETGGNILRSGSGWIEILPRPIRHTRAVSVNGTGLVTVRTDLIVSRKSSRLTLWLREAA